MIHFKFLIRRAFQGIVVNRTWNSMKGRSLENMSQFLQKVPKEDINQMNILISYS